MKRVLVVYNQGFCYDSFRFFCDSIKAGFEKNGCYTQMCTPYELEQYIGACDLLVSFNTKTGIHAEDGEYLYDKFGIPIVNFIVDHPQVHHDGLRIPLKNYYVVCLDDNHVDYIKKYYPHIKGVIRGYLSSKAEEKLPDYSKRSMGVLFTGSYLNEQICLDNIGKTKGKEIAELCYEILDEILERPSQTIEEVLIRKLETMGISLEGAEFAGLASDIMPNIEGFLRYYYRHLILKTLATGGIPVHVYGEGWEQLSCAGHSNLILHPPVSFDKSAAITADAKILLNIMPWFKAGIHDRVLTAMLNQTVCLTDESSVINREFAKECVTYRLDEIEQLPQLTEYLLQHEDYCREVAVAGYEKAQNNYSYAKIAADILEMVR